MNTSSIWTHRRASADQRIPRPLVEQARAERNEALVERRPYIAYGVHQQGRLTPTRAQSIHAEFVDTVPTGPMPLRPAAECCTEIGADDEEARMGAGAGVILIPLAVLAIVAVVALYRALPSF